MTEPTPAIPSQVTGATVDGLAHELRVAVPGAWVRERVDGRLGELARSVRMPGFRPGKVPLSLIRERYGEAVRREIIEQAVAQSSREAVVSRGLVAALPPVVTVTAPPVGEGDLEYSLSVVVLPDVGELDPGTLELERLVPEGDGADSVLVEQAMSGARERLRRQLLDQLAARYDFAAPARMVEAELAAIVRAAEAAQRQEGVTTGGDALRAAMAPIAERRVRLGLVLAAIGRREGLAGEGRELEDRVIEWLLTRARITERGVPIEELSGPDA